MPCFRQSDEIFSARSLRSCPKYFYVIFFVSEKALEQAIQVSLLVRYKSSFHHCSLPTYQYRLRSSISTTKQHITVPVLKFKGFISLIYHLAGHRKTLKFDACVIFFYYFTRKCYSWSIALYGAEIWTLRTVDKKHLGSFEMWCWRRMDKISWTHYFRNEEVLLQVNGQRNILHTIRKRKANWIGHILRRNRLLK